MSSKVRIDQFEDEYFVDEDEAVDTFEKMQRGNPMRSIYGHQDTKRYKPRIDRKSGRRNEYYDEEYER